MADSTAQRTISVIAKFKKIPEDKISLDTSLEELGLDSLDALNLIFELEEEFKISVPDERALKLRTVGQMVEGIDYLLSEKTGPTSEPPLVKVSGS
jgi:acyl carrier protein